MTRIKRNKLLTRALRAVAPGMPLSDFNRVIEIASAGHLRHLPASIAVSQALTSHVRHHYTDYDQLLDDGYDRDAARYFVVEAMNEVLDLWQAKIRAGSDVELPPS